MCSSGPDTATPMTPDVKEFFCLESVSITLITFIHTAGAHAYRDQAFWATVTCNSNSLPYATGAISCLSVMLVYCGQTVGWIKMPLGTEVDLGPGGILSDGDPAPRTERGTAAPHISAHCSLAWSPISATAELLYKRSPKIFA